MQEIALLVMAAGMGSRYGGLKQLDNVGPSGETIIDYSVYDAMRTGFRKVVFIIREDIEEEFKSKITDKYSGSIKVDFAFQDVNDLPKNFTPPIGREKPWGTGHAILSARGLINTPFIVINGDDFYGLDTYQVIYDYYKNVGKDFSMVAFQLGKTLSEFGSVKRGLCTVKNNQLQTVVETGDLEKSLTGIKSDRDIKLNGTEPVSMNVWGFSPKIFTYLNSMFIDFLTSNGEEPTSEFLIPTVVNSLISSNREKVRVLNTESSWFGVTYKKDKDYVRKRLKRLVDDKVYPKKLFV